MNAFTHKPKVTDLRKGAFFHPQHTKTLWQRVWDEARKQEWFDKDVGCVGNDGNGRFYFQKPGLTTGYALVEVR